MFSANISKNLEDISNKIEEELNEIDHDNIVSEISGNGIAKNDKQVIGWQIRAIFYSRDHIIFYFQKP